jgi:heme exporter protein CcmB
VQLVLAGHGRPVRGARELTAANRRTIAERMDRIRTALADGPRTAFDLVPDRVSEMAPGLLWLAFLFTGTLGLGQLFGAERENQCLDALLLSPLDRGALFLAKVCFNFILMLLVEIVVIPLFWILFNLQTWNLLPRIFFISLLGTVGFCVLGTIMSAITLRARQTTSITDTGIDVQVVNGPDLSFDSQASNLTQIDTYGHGTHMAGIIAGRDDGLATLRVDRGVLGVDGERDAGDDEDEPLGALGELVEELHRDPATERVPDDRCRQHPLPLGDGRHVLGVGGQPLDLGEGSRPSVAGQVGDQDSVPPCQ